MTDRPITVILVEDKWQWLESVHRVLERTADIEVVGEANDVDSAVAKIKTHQPDVALVDLRLGLDDHGGIEVARAAREVSPKTAVVVFTGLEESWAVTEAQGAHVSGFLLKSDMTDPNRIRDVVRLAADGLTLLSPKAADQLRERILKSEEANDPVRRFGLTPREYEAFVQLASGKSNAQIAAALNINEQSANNLVQRVKAKVGSKTRFAAGVLARELGLGDPEH